MIVRNSGDGELLLIRQPDHARLAGTLVSAWTPAPPVPLGARAAVLYAIDQHDNGWHEVDASPMWNRATARPHDFMDTPPEVKREIWPRGVRRLAQDSPLAAALVAEHALTLHAQRRAEAEWSSFFSNVEALQRETLRRCADETGLSREAFDRSYDLLYVGDVLSLVFCNQWRGPIDARGYRVTLGQDNDLAVSPDPFEGARVHFEVMARAIPDRAYASEAELRAAFHNGRTVTLAGTAAGLVSSER